MLMITAFHLRENISRLGELTGVADDDVLCRVNGVWHQWFDGRAEGLAANVDLNAFDIVGDDLYFSTENPHILPGVSGAADDADIYRWNAVTGFSRAVDMRELGLPVQADVDALKLRSTTDFCISLNLDNIPVPGLGVVQDEDVILFRRWLMVEVV